MVPDRVGAWDVYHAFAERYHWLPEQVDGLDVDFVEDCLARWDAEAEKAERDAALREAEAARGRGQ